MGRLNLALSLARSHPVVTTHQEGIEGAAAAPATAISCSPPPPPPGVARHRRRRRRLEWLAPAPSWNPISASLLLFSAGDTR